MLGKRRITPAGAGKTLFETFPRVIVQDHPRRCGENVLEATARSVPAGSPPQVRGKHHAQDRDRRCSGITPAGAGKTYVLNESLTHAQDHPRRCGENVSEQTFATYSKGSPPQVRGKLTEKHCFITMKRITPAGAGKTLKGVFPIFAPQDHPRRCGENAKLMLNSLYGKGSPPQVRGKPDKKERLVSDEGITPAGAGKTTANFGGVEIARDHPRRCGENMSGYQPFPLVTGSPPQVRGKQVVSTMQQSCMRITPAGAGKTQCHTSKYSR